MFNFWSNGRASKVAVDVNNASEEKRKACSDKCTIADEIAQAISIIHGLPVVSVRDAVNRAGAGQFKVWLKNATIAAEIARIRAEKAADVAQALANLNKIDVATMIVSVNNVTEKQRRAWYENATIKAEIVRMRAENEAEYSQAFDNLNKINETRAVNLAKKHRREITEERKRAYASIEAEVARIRAEKAANAWTMVKCL